MKITNVTYETADVNRLREFYTETLELPLASSADEASSDEVLSDEASSDEASSDEASFAVEVGRTTIEFTEATLDTTPYYHYTINVPTNQIDEAEEWLDQRVDLLSAEDGSRVVYFEYLDFHSVYFFDPAGNLVELAARNGLDNATEREFDASSLLGVSEVGIPVRDVTATARGISEAIDDSPVVDNPEAQPIVPVGDDRGMFVIADVGREWFMTEKPAEPHPIELTVEKPTEETYRHPKLPYVIHARNP